MLSTQTKLKQNAYQTVRTHGLVMALAFHLAFLLVFSTGPLTEAFNCPSEQGKYKCRCVNATKLVDCANLKLNGTPSDLPVDVVYLDLSNNLISDLGGLVDLTNLKTLQLSNNHISTWNSSWLTGMPLLEELTLSQNQLKKPPDLLCSQLPALKHLHLGSNQLSSKFPEDYSHCLKLSRLTLSNNPYESIDNSTLCSLAGLPEHEVAKPPHPQLLSLKLNQLKLKSAQPGSLACLSHRLQSLDLGQNSLPQPVLEGLVGGSCLSLLATLNLRHSRQLGAVSTALLNCSKSLQVLMLDASSNFIELHTEALALAPNLRLLYLNRTGIRGWTGNCLNQLRQLHALDLSFTPITTVGGRNGSDTNPLRLLTDSKNFKQLSLTNASLECDCSLYWLWQLLRDSPAVRAKIVGGADSLTCTGPPLALGARLTQFDGLSECVGFFTRRNVIILASCGAGLVLISVVFGIAVAFVKRRRRQASALSAGAPSQEPPQLVFSGASSAASSVDDLRDPLVSPNIGRRGGARQESIWIRLRRFLRERRDASSLPGEVRRPPIFDPRPPPEDYLNADGEDA